MVQDTADPAKEGGKSLTSAAQASTANTHAEQQQQQQQRDQEQKQPQEKEQAYGSSKPQNGASGSNQQPKPVGKHGRPYVGPHILLPAPKADAGDGKIVLLFDLNGVLTEKTPPRVEGKFVKRDHIVRPHIEELLRLHPHFRIGVFSSATVRTVNTALDTLYAALQRSAALRGIDGVLLPKKYDLFNVICYRDHCKPDPYWQTRADGKDHDTIKPLARLGFDLQRTVLVDNDDYKAADGEHENMLHVPHWEQTNVTNRDFPLMIQLILRHLRGVEGDVRPHLRIIERELRQLRQLEDTRFKTATDRAKGRAVTAATAQSWAGDDSIRQELAAEVVAAAAAAADGPVDAEQQLQYTPQMQQKMRQLALSGIKAFTAAALAETPKPAQQLTQLLSNHKAASQAAAAAAAAAEQASDGHKLLADAGEADAAATYSQHAMVLLLSAVWACHLTVPSGAFTFSQLTDALAAKGWPTAHAAAAVDAMIRAGTIKVWSSSSNPDQQQQQQQQWAWPAAPGTWPAAAASTPPAAAPSTAQPLQQLQQRQQQPLPQQPPAWTDCLLLLPDPRVKNLMKAVDDVTPYLEAATPAAAVELAMTLEYSCQLLNEPNKDAQKSIQAKRLQLLNNTPTMDERNKIIGLSGSWATMISAAARDLSTAHGVTLQQLLRFIKGLNPELQQQLLGSSSSSDEQQQQRLQGLLMQLQEVVKAVPVRIKDKRQKSLLGPPFGVFAAMPLPVFRQQRGGNVAQQQHADPAAAARLTRYAVGIVPNAEAVGRSIQLLLAGAKATTAAAVQEALTEAQQQQQQQLQQHQAHLQQQPQHGLLLQLKPPVTACLTVSTTLNLPAVVVQWLLQGEQIRQQQEQQQQEQQQQEQQQQEQQQGNGSGGGAVQRKDSKRARDGSAGADAATPATGAASNDTAAAAAAAASATAAVEGAAAAAEAAGDEAPGKRQKRDPRQQQEQQQEQSRRDDADALHLDALHSPHQAAAAAADSDKAAAATPVPAAAPADQHISAGGSPAPTAAAAAGSTQQDADMAEAAAVEHQDVEADLDALYDAEELRKQLEEQRDAAAAAELAALQAEEDAAAAAELAALDAGPGQNTAGMASTGLEAGSSRGAVAAAAGGGADVDADMADADDAEAGQELGSDDEDDGDGDVGEDEYEDDQGSDGDDDDDDAGDDDDMGAGGAAAADGSGGGGGSDEEYGGDAGPDGTGSFDAGAGSDAPTAGAADDEDEDDSEADPEDEGEFQGELGSEDGSDAWATDDEADGQLQLGITGLDGNEDECDDEDEGEAADALAAAAEEKAAQEAAAAMQKASAAAAAAAGQSVRGSLPLYSKLLAALAKARKLDTANAASSDSSAHPPQQQRPSRLHAELLQFASAAAPCAVERLFVETALQQLQGVAQQLWHQEKPEAVLFGSQATGLALPGSDLDVVLLRVPGCPQPRVKDKGYSAEKRKRVVQLLQAFANKLRAEGYASKKGVQVVSAKVPILKGTLQVFVSPGQLLAALGQDSKAAVQQLRTALGANSLNSTPDGRLCVDMEVDVSLGIADSAAAVNFLQRQVRTLPPLRPLLLGAKAVLRESGLNEVFTGGLGSYSLALLVLSHLQAEGVADPASSGMQPADLKSPSNMAGVKQHLRQIAAAAAGAAAGGGGSRGRQQGVEWDLGLLLQGFFLRFGALFDYTAEAVSVNQGGILRKPRQWVQSKRPFLLAVEDPAMPGRDMSSGSYAIRDVKATFTRAAGVLRVLTSELEDPSGTAQHTAAFALAARAAAGVSVDKVAAAVAAAAAASGAAQPGSSQRQKQSQQPQQQQQQRSRQFSFEVVEDRHGWGAVQADGQSRSVTPPEAAAAAGGSGGFRSSSSSFLAGSRTGVAAAAAAAGQQLTAGLKESFGMLGQLVDIVAALGRGAAAEAHRSEKARHAALRGQARLVAQKRQYHQQQQQQHEEEEEEQQPQQRRQQQKDVEVIATEQQLAAFTPNVNPNHPLLALHSRVLAALACLDPEDVPMQKHTAGPKLGLTIRQLLQQEVQLKQQIDALTGPGKTLQLRQQRSWCKNQSKQVKKQLQFREQSLKQTLRLAGDALSRMGVSVAALAPSAELLAAAAGVGAVMRPGMFTELEAAAAAAGHAGKAGKKKKQKLKQKQPQPQKQRKVRLGGQQGQQQQQRQKGRQGQQGGQQQGQGQQPSKAQRRKKQQQQQQAGKKRRRDGGAGMGGGGRGWGYDD